VRYRRAARDEPVKVILRNPRREVEVEGGRRVKDVLRELDILPETVLVIRGDELITADQVVRDGDTIELRPVMSGGTSAPERLTGQPI
jgi:sulfur carrier protein